MPELDLDSLSGDISLHKEKYDRDLFTSAAIVAVRRDMGFTTAQARCIVTGALEHRADWADAHDWGNLLEEVNWYCILYDSIRRNAERKD